MATPGVSPDEFRQRVERLTTPGLVCTRNGLQLSLRLAAAVMHVLDDRAADTLRRHIGPSGARCIHERRMERPSVGGNGVVGRRPLGATRRPVSARVIVGTRLVGGVAPYRRDETCRSHVSAPGVAERTRVMEHVLRRMRIPSSVAGTGAHGDQRDGVPHGWGVGRLDLLQVQGAP